MSLSSFSLSSLSISSSADDSSSSSSPISYSPSLYVASFVPFLWEERPGISKLHDNMGKIEEETNKLICPPSSSPVDAASVADHGSFDFPPLRLPPRLQESSHSEVSSHSQFAGDRRLMSGPARDRGRSESFSRSRLQRKSKLDDDPFWRAMKVCAQEERAASFRGLRTHTKIDGDGVSEKNDEKIQGVELIWAEKMAGQNQLRRKMSKESPLFGSREWDVNNSKIIGAMKGEDEEEKTGKGKLGNKQWRVIRDGNYRIEEKEKGRRRKQAGSEAVELSCGRHGRIGKQFSSNNKQSMNDLSGCMSFISHQTVTEPSVYRGGHLAST